MTTPLKKDLNQNLQKVGESAFTKIDKLNSELLSLTYGSLVSQLLKDYEDVAEVNKQLDKMGYRIGVRLIDEYISKSNTDNCKDFKETAENISKVGFKMFLGITAKVSNYQKGPQISSKTSSTALTTSSNIATQESFSLIFTENPLNDFVELPEEYLISQKIDESQLVQQKIESNENLNKLQQEKKEQQEEGYQEKDTRLFFSNILCGVIRGALEMVQMRCEVKFLKCQLLGDEFNEIKVTLKELLREEIPKDES